MRTAARLRADGHVPIVAPLLAYRSLAPAWPDGCVDGLVATSAAAFETGLPSGLTAEVRRVLPLWLVGQHTYGAARAAGFLGRAEVWMDSQALGAAIGEDRPGRFVYLAGRDRKPHLERAISQLLLVEAYAAETVAALPDAVLRALVGGRIAAVLHYSARSAERFLQLGENGAATAVHLCLSSDVAAPLRAAGLPHILAAATPDEDGLFALIADYAQAGREPLGA